MRRLTPLWFSILTFVLYLTFLSPTLSTPDGPELVAAVFTLGVAHAPGYVLYLLIGKLFSFLPLGGLAWRLNLVSAFFASLTVGMVYLVICKLGGLVRGRPSAVHADWPHWQVASAAAVVLAISPTFFIFALRTEVYPMNAFLLVLMVFCFLKWRVAVRSLFLTSFLSGLLLAFHTANSIYFGAFACLGLILLLKDKGRKLKSVGGILAFSFFSFLLGFSVVVYLPIRSASLPLVNFGEIAGMNGFYETLTGRIYLEQFSSFAIPWTERLYNVWYAFSNIPEEFGLLTTLLGVAGLGFLVRRDSFFALFLVLLMLIHVTFWGSSDLGASDKSFFPAHMFMNVYVVYALLIGVGGLGMFQWLGNRSALSSSFRISLLLLLLFLAPSLSSFFKNYSNSDQSRAYQFYEQGYERMSFLENPSIFLCSNEGNRLFLFWYFATVEERWPGVEAIIMDPFLETALEGVLKDPDNGEVLERLKGKRFENNGDLRSAIIREIVLVNDGKMPFYANISDAYLPAGYAKILKGGVYEIRKGIDIRELIVEMPPMDYSVGVKYGDAIELIGYNLDREALKTGSQFRITYFWRALHDIAVDYQIAVLITAEDGAILKKPFSKSLSHIPVYGTFPTSRWPVGEAIQEKYELFSYKGLKPGQYWINVGVGDDQELLPVSESRLPVEGRFARIGRFEVLP